MVAYYHWLLPLRTGRLLMDCAKREKEERHGFVGEWHGAFVSRRFHVNSTRLLDIPMTV